MTKQRTYDRIARLHELLDLPFERGRYRAIRPALFQGLGGTILDAGGHRGRKCRSVRRGRVAGIDLNPHMLERPRQRR